MDNKIKILFLFLLFANVLQAQVSEYEYKAAFIERFTRFVEWPDELENDKFVIAVVGKNPFKSTLDELLTVTKIKNLNSQIIYTDNINELSQVNLVFIAGSEKKRLKEIITQIAEQPILVISDSKGFCESGSHINMYNDDNYIRFEINEEAIKKAGLTVSSLLLSSAKIVTTDE